MMQPPLHILVLESAAPGQLVYSTALPRLGHRLSQATTAEDGLAMFREGQADVVILDLGLPDRDGLDLLAEVRTLAPQVPVIVTTANGSMNKAIEAMRAGAADFLIKPFDMQRLEVALNNAVTAQGRMEPADRRAPEGLIGSSPAMMQVHDRIRALAGSMASVFITGECGTGKDLAAQAIHRLSARAGRPFVALNCGAFAAERLEEELFGTPSAATGQAGALAKADGGTLFLDDICELDPALQPRLLRFLHNGTLQSRGAEPARKADLRLICATSRDPLECVRRGQLREDLYYRLHVVPLHMPALRERGDDVIEIAKQALTTIAQEEGKRFSGFQGEACDILRACQWPGNVRQLLNVIRQTVVTSSGGTVSAQMLPPDLTGLSPAPQAEPMFRAPSPVPALDSLLGASLAEIERRVIEATVAMQGGSITRAARVLDVAPSTIYRKMESWEKGR